MEPERTDGLLVVHKPSGPTSHDVVGQARRLLGTRAVGHAGTLDPMASGVLVLLVGEATKLAPYVSSDDKVYLATVAFGRSTHTLDAEGETVEERVLPAGWLGTAELETALATERTRTQQVPPVVSAISVGGERAYKLARRGQAPELAPRTVRVHRIEVRGVTETSITVELAVGKGYYVRSFARDLGAALGVPAHLAVLERRASGAYRLEDAVPWPASSAPPLLPLEVAAARALPVARLRADAVLRARQGKRLAADDFDSGHSAGSPSAWFDPGGNLVAIGAEDPSGGFRVLRGFRDK